MTEKANKEDVDYSKGHPASHCGSMFLTDKGYCKHFIDSGAEGTGGCHLVKGIIKRAFWCRKWAKAVTK